MKKEIFILLIIISFGSLLAQETSYNKGFILQTIVKDGDTIFISNIPQINIESNKVERTKAQQKKYDRLKINVMVAYPYAKLAGEMLRNYEKELEFIDNEKEKKAYMKKVEKELEDEFGDELSNLSISQGVILIKLIDRETGNTSYEVVEELRGKFSAFFWQGLARLFGHNLKDEYDSEGEEQMIEEIMVMIEKGQLPYYVRKKNSK